ncbi:hypothetical protein SAMN02745196_01450 [Clostridium collagenovorans DSM 3089]|uniref:Uncharacterized protein n=1 Tax=Clostridium collagenovorans DSM 3089 TaxID=1121306 RepID=A0A1M5VZU3_9CLOT|nr:hypothetical protein [Clostridium collagenovorans]SHH80494.1 hypothetical protein SAMN02745196_01450 [Clostridium collagenovorans DSM 3089]
MNIENSVKNTFELIKKINRKMNNSIISNEEEKEQEENIREISEIINRFNVILENIDKLNKENSEKLLREFIQLHLVIGDIEWQYDQLHEIIRKVIENIECKNEISDNI